MLVLALLVLMPTGSAAFDYGVRPNLALVLDSYQAGRRPGHRVSLDVTMGELETYQAVLSYPLASA